MRIARTGFGLVAALAVLALGCGEAREDPLGPDDMPSSDVGTAAEHQVDEVGSRIVGMDAKVDDFHASGDIDNAGVARGLKKLLSNAGDAAARDDLKATENMMGAFRNRVRAQRGKHIREAAADELDADAGEVIDLASGEVVPSGADLSVALVAAPDPAVAGGELEYVVTVTNPGPADVAEVGVSLLVVGDAGSPRSAPSVCAGTATADGLTYDCGVASLPAGEDVSLSFVVTPGTAGETLSGQADIVDWSGAEDPDLTNNIATASTYVNDPPAVRIELPLTGSLYEVGDDVTFAGAAADLEDGALGDAALVWTSSIAGEIGTGTGFARGDLTAGTHTITLTATDSHGAAVSATASIDVVELVPSQGASLSWELLLEPVTDIHMPLAGVWAIAPDDVYAVGNACGTGRRAILHWDGTEWSQQPTDRACPNGVWASATDDVFVVASNGRIRHFDGAVWTEHETGVGTTLHAVWGSGPDDVWAGGDGALLHYDGNAAGEWTVALTSDDVDGFLRIRSIWGSSGSDIHAVGPNNSMWHFDGIEWAPVSPGFNPGHLWGVWGSGPDDVFAVGSWEQILHWDGVAWTRQDAPAEFSGGLNDVAGTAPDDVYAVGSDGAIIHYDGTGWTRVAAGGPALAGIAAAGTDGIFAVGSRAFVLQEIGGRWKVHSTGVTLEGVWAAASDDVFVVGGTSNQAGLLLHYDGTDWTVQHSDLSGHALRTSGFRAIWGSSRSDLWAVGYGGRIVRYDGSLWREQPTGSIHNLEGVWGTGDGEVFAVGSGSTILHHDGTSWAAHEAPVTTSLQDVFGVSGDAVWAVGASGTILFYDGEGWTQQRSGVETLYSGWALATNSAFVGTSSATVLKWDGASWTTQTTPSYFARDMWAAAPNDVFAAAHLQRVMHFDGATWTAEETPARLPCCSNSLFGIWGLSATEVFAVGGYGMVVRGTAAP